MAMIVTLTQFVLCQELSQGIICSHFNPQRDCLRECSLHSHHRLEETEAQRRSLQDTRPAAGRGAEDGFCTVLVLGMGNFVHVRQVSPHSPESGL